MDKRALQRISFGIESTPGTPVSIPTVLPQLLGYRSTVWWAWDGADTWINLDNPAGWADLRARPQNQWVIYRWPAIHWRAALQALTEPEAP